MLQVAVEMGWMVELVGDNSDGGRMAIRKEKGGHGRSWWRCSMGGSTMGIDDEGGDR